MVVWDPRIGRLFAWAVLALAGCSPLQFSEQWLRRLPERVADQPQQHRRWQPQLAVLAHAELDDKQATIRNVRQCRWQTADRAVVRYNDWQVRWEDVRTVDFIVVPFPEAPVLAHTMLSFGFADGRQLVASVEARLEQGEAFSAAAGSVRQFELIYILGDETDLLGLRAELRRDEVYLYRSIAGPEKSAELLRHVLRRANQLARQPEFYDSLTNNCTTNLIEHINTIRPDAVPSSLENLLPGHSDSMAYQLGLIDTSLPFA